MATATGPDAPTGRVRWRRGLLWLLGGVIVIYGLTHAVGARTMEMAGISLAAVAVLGVIIWQFPRLYRHTHPGGRDMWRRRSRTGSLNYPGQAGRGLPSLRGPGRRSSGGGTMGRRHRPATAPFRSAGGAGRRFGGHFRGRGSGSAGGIRRRPGGTALSGRRGGTLAGARRRAGLTGAAAGRRNGAGRPFPGTSRRFRGALAGSRGRTSPLRRGSGTSGRSHGTFGRSRRSSGAFPRSRGGSGAARRAGFRPTGRRGLVPGGRGGRRAGTGTGRRAAFRPGPRPRVPVTPPPRRRMFRPSTWRRRPATAGTRPFGGRHGSTAPRGRRMRGIPKSGAKRFRAGYAGGPAPRRHWWNRRRALGTAAGPGGWHPARVTRHVRRPHWWSPRGGHVRARSGRPVRRRPLLARAYRRGIRRPYRRVRRAFRRAPFKTPVPVRYAWWRLRGRPGAPHSWGTRLRASRARYKAHARRLRARPMLARHRPWYAPWRLYPGGRPGGSWRSRLSAWRRRRAVARPRTATGRPLGIFARARRRYRLWRGHAGPGVISLRSRPRRPRWDGGRLRTLAYYLALAERPGSRHLWRRRRRAPLPLADRLPGWLGWAHRPVARWDRARMARWMRNRPPAAPVPVPRMAARRPGVSWTDPRAAASARTLRHYRARGGAMGESVRQAGDTIRQFGGWDPNGASDLHGTLVHLNDISEAVADAYMQIGHTIEGDSGLNSAYSDTLEEAAGSIRQHTSTLGEAIGGGLTSNDGQGHGEAPGVAGVVHTVNEMAGAWEPGDDPEILEQSVQALAGLTHAVQAAYTQISPTVARTGAHEGYPDALDQAAAGLGSVATGVETAFAGGLTSHPGGGG